MALLGFILGCPISTGVFSSNFGGVKRGSFGFSFTSRITVELGSASVSGVVAEGRAVRLEGFVATTLMGQLLFTLGRGRLV